MTLVVHAVIWPSRSPPHLQNPPLAMEHLSSQLPGVLPVDIPSLQPPSEMWLLAYSQIPFLVSPQPTANSIWGYKGPRRDSRKLWSVNSSSGLPGRSTKISVETSGHLDFFLPKLASPLLFHSCQPQKHSWKTTCMLICNTTSHSSIHPTHRYH